VVIVPGLPNLAKFDYVDRVNRAVDYVMRNLDQPLRLDEVARAACFSSYHFHRIFRTLMGETLASFVKRVRLERSVDLLSHRNGASLTEIALACGFSARGLADGQWLGEPKKGSCSDAILYPRGRRPKSRSDPQR
jgi:AraC-like DNA-binding protein